MGFIENPIAAEAHEYPIGFATLLIVSDGSCKAGSAAAYIHQQFPFKSGTWGPEADFSGVQINCRLYTANIKLTDNKGNNGQVDGELLALHTAVELKNHIEEVVLIKFHAVRICSIQLPRYDFLVPRLCAMPVVLHQLGHCCPCCWSV